MIIGCLQIIIFYTNSHAPLIRVTILRCSYLDACEFFLSFMEPREFVDRVESLRASESASWTLLRINDKGLIATLRGRNVRFNRRSSSESFVQPKNRVLVFTVKE